MKKNPGARTSKFSRRSLLQGIGAATAVTTAVHAAPRRPARASHRKDDLAVDPKPTFDLSPWLYMQFMEPLGATDGSVECAWNPNENEWRGNVVQLSTELAPTMTRWGGCFSSYYRWKEGIGPRDQRKTMINQLWGGHESNQIGRAHV